MKRIAIRTTSFFALAIAALALAGASLADDGGHNGDNHGAKGEHHGENRVESNFTNTDTGSCGNQWAVLSIHRVLKAQRQSDGSYRIREHDRGSFTTLAGQSPGACEKTDTNHGSVVLAGITGRYRGDLRGTVTGGTFNPHATCGPTCTQRQDIAAFFGPTAKLSCFQGQEPCRYNFRYKSNDSRLRFHDWRDRGNATIEVFRGDIATA